MYFIRHKISLMRTLLVIITLFICQTLAAQTCGNSGPSICTAGGLTQAGVTRYDTFPCVQNNIAYSEVMKLRFPDSVLVNYSGFQINVIVSSIHIDSITNLPCGLCWQADNASLTYAGGSQACIRFSGTPNEAPGDYQVKMYGTAVSPLGTGPVTLNDLGYQFFLKVVAQGDTCPPAGAAVILHTACAPATPVRRPCTPNVILTSSTAPVNCHLDSTVITVVSPSGPGTHIEWINFNIPFGIDIDSIHNSFTYTTTPGGSFTVLAIRDSAGCATNLPGFVVTATSGAVSTPDICYATYDSADANGVALKLVFQKNDWFNSVNQYSLSRQEVAGQSNLTFIGTSLPGAPGYIVDPAPLQLSQYTSNTINHYALTTKSSCGEDVGGGNGLNPSVLNVSPSYVSGYPYLTWTVAEPLYYDTTYIYSRYPGGSWRLRFATTNTNDTTWIDVRPDSSQMQYMIGYALLNQCDPSRAAATTAFSNFGITQVNPALVVRDTTTYQTPTAIGNVDRELDFILYPNPAQNELTIQFTELVNRGALSYKVYNTMGQLVKTQPLATDRLNKLNVTALPAGIYTMQLYTNGKPAGYKRFIKQ